MQAAAVTFSELWALIDDLEEDAQNWRVVRRLRAVGKALAAEQTAEVK